MIAPRLLLAIVILAATAACVREPYTLVRVPATGPATTPSSPGLIETNYRAVDNLVAQARAQLPAAAPIIVATVVNIDALDKSSTLGRVVAEHVLGRLAQFGYGVIELKVREQAYLKRNEGELLLTREIRDLARRHDARALVVGTYAEAADRVFVSLKLIEVADHRIIAAVDYAIGKDGVVRSLLEKTGS